MRRFILASLIMLFATTAVAEPIVIFQSLHDLNYAKGACEAIQAGLGSQYNLKAAQQCAAQADPRSLGRNLEIAVRSKFATKPRCKGVMIVNGWDSHYDGGSGAKYLAAQRKDHWDLLLDFQPGSSKHHWSIFHYGNGISSNSFNENIYGEGTPAEIADSVCIAVTGKGAAIR